LLPLFVTDRRGRSKERSYSNGGCSASGNLLSGGRPNTGDAPLAFLSIPVGDQPRLGQLQIVLVLLPLPLLRLLLGGHLRMGQLDQHIGL
jgi:hypothetical protein